VTTSPGLDRVSQISADTTSLIPSTDDQRREPRHDWRDVNDGEDVTGDDSRDDPIDFGDENNGCLKLMQLSQA
jgi:hypothetical protein